MCDRVLHPQDNCGAIDNEPIGMEMASIVQLLAIGIIAAVMGCR